MGIYWAQIAPYFVYGISFFIIAAALFKAEWGIFFLIPILPLQSTLDKLRDFPLGNHFVDIMMGAIMLGWIGRSLSGKQKLQESAFPNLPIILLMLYTFLSIFVGNSYLSSIAGVDSFIPRLQTWKNYAVTLPFIYFIVLNNIKTRKHIRWLTLAMLFVVLVMGVRFFRENRFSDTSMFVESSRSTGSFSYLGPNEYASFFSHYIFIAIGLLLCVKEVRTRLFLIPTVMFSYYCIVFLFSRGSYLAAFAVTAITGLARRNILIIAAVVAVFVSWNTFFPPAVVQRITMTKTEYGELEDSAALRISVWKTSMDMFQKKPVFGIGFNTFPYLGLILGDTHNLYVKLLLEQGIIGLLLFLLLLGSAFITGWKLYHTASDGFLKGLGLGFMLCILSLLISNFFGDRWTYRPLGGYFWAFMALVARANILVAEENKSPLLKHRKKRNENTPSH